MTKVKICGITNLEDALVAVEAGADLLGFIFYEPSPRYVTPEVVKEIVSQVRGGALGKGEQQTEDRGAVEPSPFKVQPSIICVGVFVNASLDTVSHLLDFCGLDAAQLHGEESAEFVNYFQGRAFKALRPQSAEEVETLIQRYQPSSPPTLQSSNPPIPLRAQACQPSNTLTGTSLPIFLLDAYHPSLYGGTGQVADWSLAASIARRYPLLLAGSLTPANVAEAVRAVQPWGVDVSSGVEREKGKKDHAKVRALVEAVSKIKSKT